MKLSTLSLFSLSGVMLALGGCSNGTMEADLYVVMASNNLEYLEDVIFPRQDRGAWNDAMDAGPGATAVRLPYTANSVRGLLTQRRDLQITSHYKMNSAYGNDALSGSLGYLNDGDESGVSSERGDIMDGLQTNYSDLASVDSGVDGDDWSTPDEPLWEGLLEQRITFAPNLYELMTAPEGSGYGQVNDDIRLILLFNLPDTQDSFDPLCEDPGTFTSDQWTYPRRFRANYAEELEEGFTIPLCEVQMMARLEVGQNTYDATADSIAVLDSLTLPDEEGTARATGRFHLAFESQDFSAQYGHGVASGSFDVGVRLDPWELELPERQLDLDTPGI